MTTTADHGQPGIFWEGRHKPFWNTTDLLIAHLFSGVTEEMIDAHKEWDDDQCEFGPDCRYCGILPLTWKDLA